MRWALLAGSFLLTMAGCTQPREVPVTAADAAFLSARSQCGSQAVARFPPFSAGAPGWFPNAFEHCEMTAGGPNCTNINPGYLPQVAPTGDVNAFHRESAFEMCMVQAGWRAQSVPYGFVWSGPPQAK